MRVVAGTAEHGPALLGAGRADAVLCHGVLMYQPEPGPLVGWLAALARPGGVVSLLAKNAEAPAFRPALQGRWIEALAVFDRDRDVGNLGVVTRGDTVEELEAVFRDAGLR